MEVPIEIVTGVVAGILSALLIFAAKELWSNSIAPWYSSLKYQGADISGSWYAKINETSKNDKESDNASADESDSEGSDNESFNAGVSTFSMILEQQAHSVTGSLQFTFDGEVKKFNIDYDLSGEYWEGYLSLYCKSKDKKSFSQASMFMKLVGNGKGLFGTFSFRNAVSDQVHSVWIGLDRN
ncbi:hypothetical protein QT397_06640 [Microbulbifer sp. MKSA007]|nr:hypothetical protein QT397_06640 [Microbulbifer sp. MKSA007]